LPSSLAHSLRMRGCDTVIDIVKGSKPGSSEWPEEADLRELTQADGKRQPMRESDTGAVERAAMSSCVVLTEHVFPALLYHCQDVRTTLRWTPEFEVFASSGRASSGYDGLRAPRFNAGRRPPRGLQWS